MMYYLRFGAFACACTHAAIAELSAATSPVSSAAAALSAPYRVAACFCARWRCASVTCSQVASFIGSTFSSAIGIVIAPAVNSADYLYLYMAAKSSARPPFPSSLSRGMCPRRRFVG